MLNTHVETAFGLVNANQLYLEAFSECNRERWGYSLIVFHKGEYFQCAEVTFPEYKEPIIDYGKLQALTESDKATIAVLHRTNRVAAVKLTRDLLRVYKIDCSLSEAIQYADMVTSAYETLSCSECGEQTSHCECHVQPFLMPDDIAARGD
jgi:hypothetical protein